MVERFELVGHGFDTIQLSFETRIPDSLAEAIAAARQKARDSRRPERVALGPQHVLGDVLRHGGGGGDAIFSTGDLGEMWFFKLSQKGDAWGVTVKIRALALLCYGLDSALEHMWKRAIGMGLSVKGYSLGRIDYRFDILTSRDFAPLEPCLIRPNRTLVRPFKELNRGHPLWDWQDDPDVRCLLRGTNIQTLMVGTIGSGNQLVLYDKRSELVAKRNFSLFESYGLDTKDKTWGLWRVEVRFAGQVLKRHWRVKTLPKLQEMIRPMLKRAITRIRYVLPDQDSKPTNLRRLHPLWELLVGALPHVSCNQPSHFAPERAEYLLRQERRRARKASLVGNAVGLAAEDEPDPESVRARAPELARSIVADALAIDPGKADQAVRRVLDPDKKFANVDNG